MARIVYNHHTELHFRANELLAYVQLATQARFHEGEGFFFTAGGKHDTEHQRRTAVWFHPSIPLEFVYDEDEPPVEVPQSTVDAFISQSKSQFGLNLAPEDAWAFVGARESGADEDNEPRDEQEHEEDQARDDGEPRDDTDEDDESRGDEDDESRGDEDDESRGDEDDKERARDDSDEEANQSHDDKPREEVDESSDEDKEHADRG